MKKNTMILLLIIAGLLIFLSLVYPVRSDIGRSIFDGTWNIRYTDCQGRLTIYKSAKVVDSDDVWLTIKYNNGRSETRLPVQSVCAEIIMDRER
jgi:hypothetical protein